MKKSTRQGGRVMTKDIGKHVANGVRPAMTDDHSPSSTRSVAVSNNKASFRNSTVIARTSQHNGFPQVCCGVSHIQGATCGLQCGRKSRIGELNLDAEQCHEKSTMKRLNRDETRTRSDAEGIG